ncbi:nicotinamide riboside kinase [Kwoniella heveanensis BCC8398]|uniref:Nicotinamide riboside kinase n=1 Tax=Kwoniella heveanensis BCC8398 TaxID=1296120 RepID=A0A1B9GTA8_9TREE|nr:nicotinamide riboside kinase [Kwoniella heveanensis BCC8398]
MVVSGTTCRKRITHLLLANNGSSGASCSGKTLLSKHIRRALPQGAKIIHQDDFCPPAEEVPYSKQYPDLQDWDDPDTCILWPQFRSTLDQVRKSGGHDSHPTHDHLNKEVKIDVQPGVFDRWRSEFERLKATEREKGTELVVYIVDGFVLYYDPAVVDNLDIRIFLRVPRDILQSRREERQVYVLQPGDVWVDPPGYFGKIVWPGYIKAHQHIFEPITDSAPKDDHSSADGTAELQQGEVFGKKLKKGWGPEGRGLVVVEPEDGEKGMTTAFDKACSAIIDALRKGAGTAIAATIS